MIRRCRFEYCTTTKRSKHLCKSWSTFWKFWDSLLSVLSRCSAARVLEFKSNSFYFAYDFCKRLNSCNSASQLEHLRSSQVVEFFQKSLRSQSTHQSRQVSILAKSASQSEQSTKSHRRKRIIFAFVFADQSCSLLSCPQISLFRQKWRNEQIEIFRTRIYKTNFRTISKNEQRQHSKKHYATESTSNLFTISRRMNHET